MQSAKHQLTIYSSHLLIFTSVCVWTVLYNSLLAQHFTTPLQNLHSLSSKKLEKMERKISYVSFSMFALLVGLLSQNLVVSVMSTTVEDQKNFYTTDPHSGNPSAGFTDSLCNYLTLWNLYFSNIYAKHCLIF